jgi:hypothetical protein
VLDEYRRAAGVRPLPGSQVVRLALAGPGGASGTAEIAWDGPRYRETRSSAGLAIERGIQGGKAYFTDEDGITRVVSEPVLAELTTRSFFWRRAWLFRDLEGAAVELGPANAASIGVRLHPRNGNLLALTFSRDARRLVSVRSPGLALEFEDSKHFRDESRADHAFEAEVRSIGLPAGPIPDATVGGWLAKWGAPSAASSIRRSGAAAVFDGRISGLPARISIDAADDGPLRLSPELAGKLHLAFSTDVLGRRVSPGATLQVDGTSFPAVSVEAAALGIEDADASAGAVLLRECVVELDGPAGRIVLHDPGRWVAPDGLFRVVLDDDGNRPVGVWNRGSRSIRLLAGVPLPVPLALAPDTLRALGLADSDRTIDGLRWGAAHFPALAFERDLSADPEWGEEGRVALDLLLRYHTFLDLPHRWIYLKPQ